MNLFGKKDKPESVAAQAPFSYAPEDHSSELRHAVARIAALRKRDRELEIECDNLRTTPGDHARKEWLRQVDMMVRGEWHLEDALAAQPKSAIGDRMSAIGVERKTIEKALDELKHIEQRLRHEASRVVAAHCRETYRQKVRALAAAVEAAMEANEELIRYADEIAAQKNTWGWAIYRQGQATAMLGRRPDANGRPHIWFRELVRLELLAQEDLPAWVNAGPGRMA